MIGSVGHPTPDTPLPTPELDAEERDQLFDRIAATVARRGMVTPAVFFLELHRPLTFLAGQTAHLMLPFLAPLVGLETARRLARLLEEPANVERLLDRIERADRERATGEGRSGAS